MGYVNDATLTSWKKRVLEQEASGLSRLEWCARQGIKYTTYRYWREQIVKQPTKTKTPAPATATWLELATPSVVSTPTAQTDGLVVRIGEVTLELRRGFDPELLREIVRTLGTA